MKKLLLIGLLLLTSCTTYTQESKRETEATFEEICMHIPYHYLRDIDTNIIYVKANASISVYYNENGKPMTYKEFKVVHIEKYHKGEEEE